MRILIRQVGTDGQRARTEVANLAAARAYVAAGLRAARGDGCEVRRTGPLSWEAREGLDRERMRVVIRPGVPR